MSPKFQVYKDAAGKTRFRIRANNNQIVAVGEAYEKYASCIKGIESVKRNCRAPTEDLTIEGGPRLPNPKYQIFKDKADKFRFHLKAANGEIIAQSEGYESREGCLNGIDVVKNCANAEIEDPFAVKQIPEGEIAEVPKPQPLVKVQETIFPEIRPETHVLKEPVIQPTTERPEVSFPELPKAPEPTIKEEELTTAIPASTEEEIDSVETTLELYPAPQNINKGDKVPFQGRLFKRSSGKGISDAKIRIYELDKSILGNDYIAYGTTGEDGSFSIPWKARSLTWRKNTGNIYARFSGNEKAKPSQSTVQEITIK